MSTLTSVVQAGFDIDKVRAHAVLNGQVVADDETALVSSAPHGQPA